jgi:hypothetical protein
MVLVRKLVLDVLKPHQPNALDFCKALADVGENYSVNLMVIAVDEKTESVQVIVEAPAIDFDALQQVINKMGASLHSIDEVEVNSQPDES